MLTERMSQVNANVNSAEKRLFGPQFYMTGLHMDDFLFDRHSLTSMVAANGRLGLVG